MLFQVFGIDIYRFGFLSKIFKDYKLFDQYNECVLSIINMLFQ